MAAAIHSCFASSLSTKNHFTKVWQRPEAQYKIVKALDPIFDAISEIAIAFDATEPLLEGVAYGRRSVKIVRDILGLVHIFTHVIPVLIYAPKLFWDLGRGLFSQKDVHLHPLKKPFELAYYESAKGNVEKILCLGILLTKCVKSASSVCKFACKPIMTSKTLHSILLVKHSSELAVHAFEMGFHYSTFQRALDEGRPFSEIYPLFSKKILISSLGLIEKSLQLINDIIKLLQGSVPASVRLPLTFAVTGIGLYRIWLNTA